MSVGARILTPQDFEAADLATLDGKAFTIDDGEFNVAYRFKSEPGAKYLFVMPNGAVDRSKVPLPVFARWNWGKVLGGHVLSVCDPTLGLDPMLRLGWFLGTRASKDPMLMLLRIVRSTQLRLGVADQHVIFYGSSGGGFAALRAAAMLDVGRVIGINIQTLISTYYVNSAKAAAKVFDPKASLAASSERFPQRWDALRSVDEGRARGRDLRVLYIQNVDDPFHYERYYVPFCEKYGLPVSGGLSADGKMLSNVYTSVNGHGTEPPEVVKYIVSDGLQHLDG